MKSNLYKIKVMQTKGHTIDRQYEQNNYAMSYESPHKNEFYKRIKL